MAQIYICEMFNSEIPKLNYENIYNGNLIEPNEAFQRFENNMKIREMLKEKQNTLPCDPLRDPLLTSNGYIYIDFGLPHTPYTLMT